jgi:hypothetical protein
MEPTPADQIATAVDQSPLLAQYGTAVNPASATESIEAKEASAANAAQAAEAGKQSWDQEIKRSTRRTRSTSTSTSRYRRQSPLEKAAGEAARTAARELIKSIFKRR